MTENDKIAHEKERRLYDSFDKQGICISIGCAFWRSISLFRYEIAQQGKEILYGQILYSRHEAEAAAFKTAFDISAKLK